MTIRLFQGKPWRSSFAAFLVATACACTGPTQDVGTEQDDVTGQSAKGPPSATSEEASVWEVRNQWADTTTSDARMAGPGWDANSGLSWEEKYGRWVASFEDIPNQDMTGTTVRIPTPFGDRALPAPALECGEFALFLRLTFSSWYHLPFYMQAYDARAQRTLFAGHFGFVDSTGAAVENYPAFHSQYKDFSSTYRSGSSWPRDESLRALHIGNDDTVKFINSDGSPAGAGAVFDELYLNKRVGHFALHLLTNFGSINLADDVNMFQIHADAIAPGDVLLHRHQRKGIGHTVPVLRVAPLPNNQKTVAVATGSMPRRQPLWNSDQSAVWYFTDVSAGGPGKDYEGDLYAKLGGGLHRWRTPILSGGSWQNRVAAVDRSVFIDSSDLKAIAARPQQLDDMLTVGTPATQRDNAVSLIESARQQLRQTPSSCSARTQREDAFAKAYKASADPSIGETAAQFDGRTRKLEDYVFGELTYEASKTCCWDTATPAMAEIILDFAKTEQDAATAAKMCVEPTVFAASHDGGYAKFRDHAAKMGRAADWVEWHADESCPQANVLDDTRAARPGITITPFCALPPPSADPPAEANSGAETGPSHIP